MRTDSIYSQLERHDKKNGTTFFLDLMIFIEEATGDKFGKAASLVRDEWKFKTSKTALFDGYASARSLWLLDRAKSFAQTTGSGSNLDAAMSQIVGQQSFQTMLRTDNKPEIVLGFAKLEVEKIKADATIRRVKLLEENAAKARAKLEGVIKIKGGLSAESRAQIEEAARLL
jgi:hypothetical protein